MLLDQIINNYRLQFYSQFFQGGKEGKLERLLYGEINLVYVIQNLKKKSLFSLDCCYHQKILKS